jgi:hypothetical protein
MSDSLHLSILIIVTIIARPVKYNIVVASIKTYVIKRKCELEVDNPYRNNNFVTLTVHLQEILSIHLKH